MSTPAVPVHIPTRPHSDNEPDPVYRCTGLSPSSPHCKRRVTWYIAGVGPYCHVCFENYFAINWRTIEIGDVYRLSDRESDFFRG